MHQLSKILPLKHREVECIEKTTSGMTLRNYVIYANYMGVSLRYLFSATCSQDIPQRQSLEEEYVRLVKEAIPRLEKLSEPGQLCTVSHLTGVPATTLGYYPQVKALLTDIKRNAQRREDTPVQAARGGIGKRSTGS